MGGVNFHPTCGWVSAEFTVICLGIQKVIEVFAVVWRIAGVVIQGMWVEFGMGVGAPHVSGFECFGSFGGDLVNVGGVYTDKLAFLGKEVGSVREWFRTVESLSCALHGGFSDSNPFLGPIGEVKGGR